MRKPVRSSQSVHAEALRRTWISLRRRLNYTAMALALGAVVAVVLALPPLEGALLAVVFALAQLAGTALNKYLSHHRHVLRGD